MALQGGASPRQVRVPVRQLQKLLHDAAALGAIIARKHSGRAEMKFFDRCKARQTEGFARYDCR